MTELLGKWGSLVLDMYRYYNRGKGLTDKLDNEFNFVISCLAYDS